MLMKFCQEASEWGVLEVAFGGGEPTLFKNWQGFIHELYETSGLCINFTTNGMLLSEEMIKGIEGNSGRDALLSLEEILRSRHPAPSPTPSVENPHVTSTG